MAGPDAGEGIESLTSKPCTQVALTGLTGGAIEQNRGYVVIGVSNRRPLLDGERVVEVGVLGVGA